MTDRNSTRPANREGERIARRLSRAGVASRREAERLVAEGKVRVDGQMCTTPATLVTTDSRIQVNGRLVPKPEPSRLWRFHKPTGVLVSRGDPAGRSTIYDLLPKRWQRLVPVGRLDFNSEGLLLLTNDGALKRSLELPVNRVIRVYRARVTGTLGKEAVARLAKGLTLEGERLRPIRARVERQKEGGSWLRLELTEGRWREVRRALAAVGNPVERLVRVSYGPYKLAGLRRGELVEVSAESVQRLSRSLDRPKKS